LCSHDALLLTQKRIFIFPSRIGLFFLVLIALMFLTAVNYQNNLLFSFSCLLVSIMISAIAFTYRNLSGLKISAGKCTSVFEGEFVNVNALLSSSKGDTKEGVYLGFDRNSTAQLDAISDEVVGKLRFKAKARGWVDVPRFSLFSHYPLGLLRCWTWVKLDFDAVVYPAPIFMPFKRSLIDEGDEINEDEVDCLVKGQSADDFYGFKIYQPGDSLKHVAWRQYAKTSQLLTKEFSSYEGVSRWLDWSALEGVSVERRLQIMCGWVLESEKKSDEYGLSIPGCRIELGQGDAHKHECLSALALHGFKAGKDGKGIVESNRSGG
jgi:uncharacterized protein (DUF58 family)